MDFLGMKVYFGQRTLQAKTWLGKRRGSYTNHDLVWDWIQVFVIIGLIVKDFV